MEEEQISIQISHCFGTGLDIFIYCIGMNIVARLPIFVFYLFFVLNGIFGIFANVKSTFYNRDLVVILVLAIYLFADM